MVVAPAVNPLVRKDMLMPESGVEPDSAEAAALCTIDKPAGSEQDRCALRACAAGSMPQTNMRGYHSGLSQRQNDFRRETVFGALLDQFFPVKKEMADGLSVLFDTGDI